MKVALVYDRVNKIGGIERALVVLHKLFPEAPLFTSVYNPETAPWAKVFKVIPSFLQKIQFFRTRHELIPYLMPFAFESFNFDEYDVVISVTSEAAKGIITKPKTLHLCYCLTPTRYLWSGYKEYFRSSVFRFFSFPLVAYLRYWDKIAAQRPDIYIAISKNVRRRVKRYYKRDSEVIYPPIDTKKWKTENGKQKTENYFLLVSRLDFGYKKVDLAVKAFNELGLPLKIVGMGKELGRLRRMAKMNIEFLGQLTDRELLGYYQNCQALIFPQEEDFGLAPLEAQACGRPVIAYRSGGALESVVEGKTGMFFSPQTVKALMGAVEKFVAQYNSGVYYSKADCRKNAEKFNKERFKREIKKFIEQEWIKKK